jgi:hypothetical protein
MLPTDSPWRSAEAAGKRINKGKRFVQREIRLGRMRGARIGGRGEYLTQDAWIDEWVEKHASPLVVPLRRRT